MTLKHLKSSAGRVTGALSASSEANAEYSEVPFRSIYRYQSRSGARDFNW